MGDSSYFLSQSNNNHKNRLKSRLCGTTRHQSWIALCPKWSPLCHSKKPTYIEAYTFNEDSDDGVSDNTPLMSQDPLQQNGTSHVHTMTGYLSAFELMILVVYSCALLAFSLLWAEDPHSPFVLTGASISHTNSNGEKLLALFCMVHSLLWLIVAIMDRLVQWRLQIMRKKGYLKFYRKMKNMRRIPFVMISTGTASILVFLSLVFYYHQTNSNGLHIYKNFTAFHVMYIIVGVEMLITLPCLLVYIIQTTKFNCLRPPPDVIQETTSIANSPTATMTSVGFREGEELDELLERQADMIRYLQQHNASLGRRIMELQARTVD